MRIGVGVDGLTPCHLDDGIQLAGHRHPGLELWLNRLHQILFPISHMDVGQNGRPMWDHRCECLV